MKIKTPPEIRKILNELVKNDQEKDDRYIYLRDKKDFEHRIIWEKEHGNIPIGMVIHHKNFNKKDNRIENLECLSFKEHMFKHRKHQKA